MFLKVQVLQDAVELLLLAKLLCAFATLISSGMLKVFSFLISYAGKLCGMCTLPIVCKLLPRAVSPEYLLKYFCAMVYGIFRRSITGTNQ